MELPQTLAESDPELLFHLHARSSSFANGVSDSNYSPKLTPFEMLIEKYSFQKAAVYRYVKLQVYTGKLITLCDTNDHMNDQKNPNRAVLVNLFPNTSAKLKSFQSLSQRLTPTATIEAGTLSQINLNFFFRDFNRLFFTNLPITHLGIKLF